MNILTMHPLTELFRMFRGRRRELTAQQQHIDEELVLDAYEQVAGELGSNVLMPIAAKAHKAETLDIEASRLIEGVLADGSVDQSEIATLRKAQALARRSAECDHDTSELAKFEAA